MIYKDFCLKLAWGASLLLDLRSWRLIHGRLASSLEVVHRNSVLAVKLGLSLDFVWSFCVLLYRGTFQTPRPYGMDINCPSLAEAWNFQMLGMALGNLEDEGKMKCEYVLLFGYWA